LSEEITARAEELAVTDTQPEYDPTTEPPKTTINDWADFWRYDIGVNVIPAHTERKITYESWAEWQDKPIPDELYSEWKSSGAFNKGIAIILGKVWHNPLKKELYLIGIDLDNQKAIEEVSIKGLEDLATHVIVEQHKDDTTKAHVLLYSHKPFPKKSSDKTNIDTAKKIQANDFPAIEVKGLGSHGILFVSPSIHQNGHPYQIIGTKEPDIVDDFVQHIDNICRKYSIPYLDAADNGNGKALLPIQDLFKPDFTILEGHNRHEGLMRIMESLIARNSSILSLEEIKPLARQWNQKHCSPPLDDKEFEKLWECATDFIAKKGPKSDEEDDKGIRSAADLLVQLAIENTSLLFKDQYGMAHAQVHIADHDEIIRVESSKFKRYLARLFYDRNGNKVVNADSITNAIQVIQAKAEYEGQTIPLSLRVAWQNGDIYFDLSNNEWQCIKISQHNWELIDHSPYPMFIRYNQISQTEPDRNYEHDIFDRFLKLTNLKENHDRILIKAYIISLFVPDIPHAMLILHGEKGSAKSTLQTLIKLLVDPGKPRLLTIYNDVKEFIQQLAHNHVAYYDNLKRAPQWLSDEACKAVTGVGSTKRKLYSDDDDIVYEYRRCLGFSGINVSLTEPDALDRSMMIELQRIKKENTKQDAEIVAEFLELRPKLLGYIFDILTTALQIKPKVKLNDLPRMADFAIWGESIARAMGYKDLEFIHAYYDNIGKQNIEAIENHPLGQAIARFIEEKQEFLKGSPLEILEQLEIFAHNNKIKTDHRLWPKAANSLTRRLNQIRSNLLEGLAIDVKITRVTDVKGKFNTSSIEIRKLSPEPPEPPETNNYEGNSFATSGDIPVTGDTVSPVNDMPPAITPPTHGQNLVAGDTGDTGGIFSTEGDRETRSQQDQSSIFQCYHCEYYHTDIEADYLTHGATNHPSKPMFPSKTDLEVHGLKPQGKSWEI
jgi:hypothetical protein